MQKLYYMCSLHVQLFLYLSLLLKKYEGVPFSAQQRFASSFVNHRQLHSNAFSDWVPRKLLGLVSWPIKIANYRSQNNIHKSRLVTPRLNQITPSYYQTSKNYGLVTINQASKKSRWIPGHQNLYYLKSTKVFRFLLSSVSLRPSSTIDNFTRTHFPIGYPGNYWAWCRGPLKLPTIGPRITSTNHVWLLPG
jgi:hypothetical protein